MKSLRDFRHWLFYRLLTRRADSICQMGNAATGCHWTFCQDLLNAGSIVYSGGVGKDISFETELQERFGCQIWLFDPSPTGRETMDDPRYHSPSLHFEPLGLAGTDGVIHLAPPSNAEEGSWFASHSTLSDVVSVPCEKLSTIMARNGHRTIDLLKLDIEGAEYEVLESVLSDRIPVDQICVEYHHGMLPGIKRSQTIRSVLRLLAFGYRLVDKFGNNHIFVHRRAL
ncbi:MAG: FkbM family methyltransferase [Terrimicrobiaceae bacterium]|nr:FkbM family methyltransferase [Terrimicrobiaceae bacterium]